MPFEISGLDIAMFTLSVAAFSVYHAWFFVSTTIAESRRSEAAASEAEQLARLEAIRTGRMIELEDYQRAQHIQAPPPSEG